VSTRLGLDDGGDLFNLERDDEDVDSIGGLLGKVLGRVPLPGVTAEYGGLLLTGGASRGRGRGLATVFVERAPSLIALEESTAPRTGEVRVPRTGEIRTPRKGE